jgi:hypothetical protein
LRPRLADFLERVRQFQPSCYALTAPSIGDARARLPVVWLAS